MNIFLHMPTLHKAFQKTIWNVSFVYVDILNETVKIPSVLSKNLCQPHKYLLYIGAPVVITNFTWIIILEESV
jgi:hypothetical protein